MATMIAFVFGLSFVKSPEDKLTVGSIVVVICAAIVFFYFVYKLARGYKAK
jgi:hypothetical protein